MYLAGPVITSGNCSHVSLVYRTYELPNRWLYTFTICPNKPKILLLPFSLIISIDLKWVTIFNCRNNTTGLYSRVLNCSYPLYLALSLFLNDQQRSCILASLELPVYIKDNYLPSTLAKYHQHITLIPYNIGTHHYSETCIGDIAPIQWSSH